MIAMRTLRQAMLLIGPLAALPGVAHAEGEVTASADAAVNIGYDNNPFSETGSNTSSGFAQVHFVPQVKFADAHDVVILSGLADYEKYFQHYNDSVDYGAKLDYAGAPSARLKDHLALSYDSAIIGTNQFVAGNLNPTDPSAPVTTGSDISLYGTRDRRQTAQASGDISYALSPYNSLGASAYYVRARYGQNGSLGNYDGFGGSFNYSRRISERLQIGLQGSASRYDYQSGVGGTTVYSPQVSFSDTLTAHWTISGALGVSFVERQATASSTSFSGNARLCYTGARSNFCLIALHAVLPTGFSGTQNETGVSASYSYKLSEHGTIVADANYARNSAIGQTNTGQNEYLRGSAGYERTLNERIRLSLKGKYAQIFGSPLSRAADYGVVLGITVHMGSFK